MGSLSSVNSGAVVDRAYEVVKHVRRRAAPHLQPKLANLCTTQTVPEDISMRCRHKFGCIDNFPVDLPDTQADQVEILRRLRRWRVVSNENLKTIQLGDICEFNYEYDLDPFKDRPDPAFYDQKPGCGPPREQCAHLAWTTPRERPAVFESDTCRHIRITKPLHVGLGLNSQVFAGILGDSNADGPSSPVAVKIYRPSQMDESSWGRLQRAPVFGEHVCIGLNNFKREYWAYKKMKPLQGTVIPHVYGFFKFLFNEDELCIALVMEPIDTIIPEWDYVNSVGERNTGAINAFCNGLSAATHAVHSYGLGLTDFDPSNVIIPRETPSFPVLVDFADAGNVEETPLQYAPAKIRSVATEFGFDREETGDWLRGRYVDPEFVAMFHVPKVLPRVL